MTLQGKRYQNFLACSANIIGWHRQGKFSLWSYFSSKCNKPFQHSWKRHSYVLTGHVKYRSCLEPSFALLELLDAVHFYIGTDIRILSSWKRFFYVVVNFLPIVLTVTIPVIVTTFCNNVPDDKTMQKALVGNCTWNSETSKVCVNLMELNCLTPRYGGDVVKFSMKIQIPPNTAEYCPLSSEPN